MQITRYSWWILTKLEFSQQVFENPSNMKFHEHASRGSQAVPCGPTDGRTDGHHEANSRVSKYCERAFKTLKPIVMLCTKQKKSDVTPHQRSDNNVSYCI